MIAALIQMDRLGSRHGGERPPEVDVDVNRGARHVCCELVGFRLTFCRHPCLLPQSRAKNTTVNLQHLDRHLSSIRQPTRPQSQCLPPSSPPPTPLSSLRMTVSTLLPTSSSPSSRPQRSKKLSRYGRPFSPRLLRARTSRTCF